MAWKTKFDNASTNFGSNPVRPMVHGDCSELTLRDASILLFCRLPKFGRLSALAITMGRFPASSILLRRATIPLGRSHSLALATFSAATPQADAASKSNGANNENRLRRAHSPAPMKCGAMAADGVAEHFWL